MVFLYVQYTAFRFQGPKGYLFHLAGEPQDAVGWILSPLFLVLHVLGEFIKPVSLGLRLFGNILGEHVLLGVFSLLGIALTQFLLSGFGVEHVWIGIPLHLLLVPIALLGSTIQATVFVVLSTIYIFLVLPHHEGPEGHGAH
jgi:F-type H+-transporting ATPase subunit a